MTIEFKPWPKIARLFRDCIITEKIDGTNSAVVINTLDQVDHIGHGFPVRLFDGDASKLVAQLQHEGETYLVFAQSRNRFITPQDDNFGFATWVESKAAELVSALGPGVHAGEWWGSGIGRGYGLLKGDKRWSVFNVTRHRTTKFGDYDLDNVQPVPVLYEGPFSTHAVEHQVEILRRGGSVASPGFMRPEGVITFHTAANLMFKTTLEKDEQPKGFSS